MTDVSFPEGDESVLRKYKVNPDGSYTPYVEASITGDVVVDNVGLSAGDNNIGNVDIVTLPDLNPVLVTADADLTQKITCGAPGGLTQGPNKTNTGGWIIKPASTNTGSIWYMFHGQTAANKGFPLAVGESMYVPVLNLNSLDFDVTTSGNSIIAAKV